MSIVTCEKCGAKNRVDERVTVVGKEPACGRCGARLPADGGEDRSRDEASANKSQPATDTPPERERN